ncbi:unnamed protein product [Phytomonas sp. Hart1]|nr:unnamed protein product [Phytomonas sp. Hart1]|eukprot:CCW65945.1 unnamed protein product [Phytomonas sp. isolate Hart1]
MGILLDAFEALLMAPNGILVDENAMMSDAETLVSLRLLCNVFAVQVKVPCEISQAHITLLGRTTKRLTFFALQKLINGNIKSSLVSLLINLGLYLPTLSNQGLWTTENPTGENFNAKDGLTSSLAGLFITVSAKFLLYEPIGSAFTVEVLRALFTLFYLSKFTQVEPHAACSNVESIGLDDLCKMVKSTLQYTLPSIESGSNVDARPIAKEIMTILGL